MARPLPSAATPSRRLPETPDLLKFITYIVAGLITRLLNEHFYTMGKRDRRAQGDRREAIRWGEGNDRRKRKRDRRKSMRGARDRLPP